MDHASLWIFAGEVNLLEDTTKFPAVYKTSMRGRFLKIAELRQVITVDVTNVRDAASSGHRVGDHALARTFRNARRA